MTHRTPSMVAVALIPSAARCLAAGGFLFGPLFGVCCMM